MDKIRTANTPRSMKGIRIALVHGRPALSMLSNSERDVTGFLVHHWRIIFALPLILIQVGKTVEKHGKQPISDGPIRVLTVRELSRTQHPGVPSNVPVVSQPDSS